MDVQSAENLLSTKNVRTPNGVVPIVKLLKAKSLSDLWLEVAGKTGKGFVYLAALWSERLLIARVS